MSDSYFRIALWGVLLWSDMAIVLSSDWAPDLRWRALCWGLVSLSMIARDHPDLVWRISFALVQLIVLVCLLDQPSAVQEATHVALGLSGLHSALELNKLLKPSYFR